MQKTDGALLDKFDAFARRHIGPNGREIDEMLTSLGFENLDALIEATVPKNIRLGRALDLPEAKGEREALDELRAISRNNRVGEVVCRRGVSGWHHAAGVPIWSPSLARQGLSKKH